MAFRFSQTSGAVQSPTGQTLFVGYSGHGAGRSNSAMQHVRKVGPLPQGKYSFPAEFECSAPLAPGATCPQCHGIGKHEHGPDVLRLTPIGPPENPVYTDEQKALIADLTAKGDPRPWMFGRDGMLNHGDSATHDASLGCMITDHPRRVLLKNDTDKELDVVA